MHFIIGNIFTVANPNQSQGTQILGITPQGVHIKPIAEHFEIGKKYQIYSINPNKDKINYSFKGPRGTFEKEFLNISEAEEFISKISGIRVPDYNKFYRSRHD